MADHWSDYFRPKRRSEPSVRNRKGVEDDTEGGMISPWFGMGPSPNRRERSIDQMKRDMHHPFRGMHTRRLAEGGSVLDDIERNRNRYEGLNKGQSTTEPEMSGAFVPGSILQDFNRYGYGQFNYMQWLRDNYPKPGASLPARAESALNNFYRQPDPGYGGDVPIRDPSKSAQGDPATQGQDLYPWPLAQSYPRPAQAYQPTIGHRQEDRKPSSPPVLAGEFGELKPSERSLSQGVTDRIVNGLVDLGASVPKARHIGEASWGLGTLPLARYPRIGNYLSESHELFGPPQKADKFVKAVPGAIGDAASDLMGRIYQPEGSGATLVGDEYPNYENEQRAAPHSKQTDYTDYFWPVAGGILGTMAATRRGGLMGRGSLSVRTGKSWAPELGETRIPREPEGTRYMLHDPGNGALAGKNIPFENLPGVGRNPRYQILMNEGDRVIPIGEIEYKLSNRWPGSGPRGYSTAEPSSVRFYDAKYNKLGPTFGKDLSEWISYHQPSMRYLSPSDVTINQAKGTIQRVPGGEFEFPERPPHSIKSIIPNLRKKIFGNEAPLPAEAQPLSMWERTLPKHMQRDVHKPTPKHEGTYQPYEGIDPVAEPYRPYADGGGIDWFINQMGNANKERQESKPSWYNPRPSSGAFRVDDTIGPDTPNYGYRNKLPEKDGPDHKLIWPDFYRTRRSFQRGGITPYPTQGDYFKDQRNRYWANDVEDTDYHQVSPRPPWYKGNPDNPVPTPMNQRKRYEPDYRAANGGRMGYEYGGFTTNPGQMRTNDDLSFQRMMRAYDNQRVLPSSRSPSFQGNNPVSPGVNSSPYVDQETMMQSMPDLMMGVTGGMRNGGRMYQPFWERA